MKICSIKDCGRLTFGRGYCQRHYWKDLTYGDPLAIRHHATPEGAFGANTKELSGGCVEWTGYIHEAGYGYISVDGKRVLAHRYAWERANGPIPEGVQIDHACHNRACVNAMHLRAVTNSENAENRSGLNSNNTSGYRGVTWDRRRGGWRATVMRKGKNHHGGLFATAEEANEAAIALRNELFTHNLLDRVEAS